MAKKLESSKATAKHIKQITSSMQGTTQINVLRHNCTSLPPKKKNGSKNPNLSKETKPRQPQQHRQVNQHQPYDKNPNQCTRCGDSPHAQGFNCPAKKYQYKHCTKSDISQRCALPKMHTHSHSNIIEVSQSRHTKLFYLNILISSNKTHVNVIMMMSL